MQAQYEIHDNGTICGSVAVENNNVRITSQAGVLVECYHNVLRVMVGRDPNLGEHGNSVLIQISENTYVFIGTSIYEFTSRDRILEYYSWLTHNDVAYPIALGQQYVYNLLDRKFLGREHFIVRNWPDAYTEFNDSVISRGPKLNLIASPIEITKIIRNRQFPEAWSQVFQ